VWDKRRRTYGRGTPLLGQYNMVSNVQEKCRMNVGYFRIYPYFVAIFRDTAGFIWDVVWDLCGMWCGICMGWDVGSVEVDGPLNPSASVANLSLFVVYYFIMSNKAFWCLSPRPLVPMCRMVQESSIHELELSPGHHLSS
jgi:hypothetical protein